MTEAAIRSLINNYIVDNQGYGITPAQMRDMMQQTIDFVLSEAGGSGTPNLNAVLTTGALSAQPMSIGTSLTDGAVTRPQLFQSWLGGTKFAEFGYVSGGPHMGLLSHGTAFYAYILASAGQAGDANFLLPTSGGTLATQTSITLQVATNNGATTTNSITAGTSTTGVIHSTSAIDMLVAGIRYAFLGIVGGAGQLFLRAGSGAGGVTVVAQAGTGGTLTLPNVTDIVAVKGDVGVRYRLTVTSTGASSYTWGIPLLSFSPLMWFIQHGGPTSMTSDVYGSGTTTSVTVNYMGAAPTSGSPLTFYVLIFG